MSGIKDLNPDKVKLLSLMNDVATEMVSPMEAANTLERMFSKEDVPADELWDRHSQYLDDDLDSLRVVAGSDIMTKSGFMEAMENFEKFRPNKAEILSEAVTHINYFVKRVEEGSIRSKITYERYRNFLLKIGFKEKIECIKPKTMTCKLMVDGKCTSDDDCAFKKYRGLSNG